MIDLMRRLKVARFILLDSRFAITVLLRLGARLRGINAGVGISIICMIGGGRLSAIPLLSMR
jgi:hypothetical protein